MSEQGNTSKTDSPQRAPLRRSRSHTRGHRSGTPTGNSRSSYGGGNNTTDNATTPRRRQREASPARNMSTLPTTSSTTNSATPSGNSSSGGGSMRGMSPVVQPVMKGLRKLRNMASRSQSPGKARSSLSSSRSQSPNKARSSLSSKQQTSDSKRSSTTTARSSSARRAYSVGDGTMTGISPSTPQPQQQSRPRRSNSTGRRGAPSSSVVGTADDLLDAKTKKKSIMSRLADEEYVRPAPRVPRPRKSHSASGPPLPAVSGHSDNSSGNAKSNAEYQAPPLPELSGHRSAPLPPVSGHNKGDDRPPEPITTSKQVGSSPSGTERRHPEPTTSKQIGSSASGTERRHPDQTTKQVGSPQQSGTERRHHKRRGQGSKGRVSSFDSAKPLPPPASPPRDKGEDHAEGGMDIEARQQRQRQPHTERQSAADRKHKRRSKASSFETAKPLPMPVEDDHDGSEDDNVQEEGVVEEPVLQPSEVSSHQRTKEPPGPSTSRKHRSSSRDPSKVASARQAPEERKPRSEPDVVGSSKTPTVAAMLALSIHSNPENSTSTAETPITPGDSAKRSNLDNRALESMQEIKDAIKQMRHQRRKVKFGDFQNSPLGDSSGSLNTNLTSITNPNNLPAAAPNVSKTRLEGITMSDLEVGFLKGKSPAPAPGPPATIPAAPPGGSSPSTPTMEDILKANPAVEREIKVASLQKQIKKVKKSVKRTCRDVWAERDDITQLQRKNWSLRKTLVNSDAPRDSVTTLNLKIEKLLRQERELDMEMDRAEEEKEFLEEECGKLAKSISEFKDLLDELNLKVVPLLPPIGQEADDSSLSDDNDDTDHRFDELADTIHSTEG